MRRILWGVKLYLITIGMNYRSYIRYNGWSALANYLGMFLGYAAEVATIWVMMRVFPSLGGFSFWEVMFLYSLELLTYSLANTIVRAAWNAYDLVLRGQLDDYLTKPASPLLLISAKYYETAYIGHIILSIILMILVKVNLLLTWGLVVWLEYFAFILGATAIYMGVSAIPSLMSFWWGNTDKMTGVFRWSFREIIRYPISIYPGWIRVILTIILPYALVNYYPALVLLNKADKHYHSWILLAVVGVGILMLCIIYLLWRKGLKRYESAGG